MNTPHERLTRTTFSLPLGEDHALVGGAVNARPLLFPHRFPDHPATAVPVPARSAHPADPRTLPRAPRRGPPRRCAMAARLRPLRSSVPTTSTPSPPTPG